MRIFSPNITKSQEFISSYNYNVYCLYKPLKAVIIADTDIADTSTILAKKGLPVFILEISACGWCYIQIEKLRGYIQCRFLQLQQEIDGIPIQYTVQFFSPDKTECLIPNNDEKSKQLKSNSNRTSFFRTNAKEKNKHLINYSERKQKRSYPSGSEKIECLECGTTSTPEWRMGPKGKRSLCNACGLRWSKRQIALKDKEKCTNNEAEEADKSSLNNVDSSISYIPKNESFPLKYSLSPITNERFNEEKKVKNASSEELPAANEKETDRISKPDNRYSLSYICNK